MISRSRSRPKKNAHVELGVLVRREALVRAAEIRRHRTASATREASSADVLVERNVEHVDAALAPELALDRVDRDVDRPRPVGHLLPSPDAVEEDAETPVAKRVAEEEEVAAAEPGDERDRHEARNVRLGQIVDVVVLRDGEALPPTLGLAIDLAEQLEDRRFGRRA